MTTAMAERVADARVDVAAVPLRSANDRRAQLKAFLISCRSRLKPEHVGLPQTARRRVDGLRREEVAELAGVSTDWYRFFEGGRVERVSVGFLARLADAMRLDPVERITLFCLALPEVYEAYASQSHLTSPLELVKVGHELPDPTFA